MTPVRRILAALTLSATAVTVTATAAHAGQTGGTGSTPGFSASVYQITLSGDVDRGRVASVPAPPPLCWWSRVSLDLTDAEAVEAFITANSGGGPGSSTENLIHGIPSEAYITAMLERALTDDIALYEFNYKDGYIRRPNDPRIAEVSQACGSPVASYSGSQGGTFVTPTRFQAFPDGDPPAPVPDPRSLAEYAFAAMRLVEPTLDWNPKATGTGGSSLVHLPTWLWVDDPEAIEEREVTATVPSGLSVTVTATTGGLTISSPAGSRECTAAQAGRSYASGVSESSACTIAFSRSSVGYPRGFPVAAAAVWAGSWTSNTGDGDDLGTRPANGDTFIPVAESQSIVTGTR